MEGAMQMAHELCVSLKYVNEEEQIRLLRGGTGAQKLVRVWGCFEVCRTRPMALLFGVTARLPSMRRLVRMVEKGPLRTTRSRMSLLSKSSPTFLDFQFCCNLITISQK